MFKSINLVLIAVLVILSAHSEIKASIPDFSRDIKASLAPMEADSLWSTSLPSKNKFLDEQSFHRLAYSGHTVSTVPESAPFDKMVFIQQTLAYRSSYVQPFPLLI